MRVCPANHAPPKLATSAAQGKRRVNCPGVGNEADVPSLEYSATWFLCAWLCDSIHSPSHRRFYLKKGWLAVQRRTFNTVILGSGLNMLGRGSAHQGTDKTKAAGKLLHAKKIETRLQAATAWHVRYLSKDVNDVAHEVTGIVLAPSKQGKDRPIITWCHGTTGLGDVACPSAQPDPARELTVYFNPGVHTTD